MPSKIYIAQLKNDAWNDDTKSYLEGKGIEIVKYLSQLNILIIKSEKPLKNKRLKYILHIEEDQMFSKTEKGEE